MSLSVCRNNAGVVAGALSLVILFYTLLATVLCFACGGVVNVAIFPIATLVAVVTILKLFGLTRQNLKTVIVSIVAIVVAAWVCSLLTDQSYDGNAYHGEVIGRLLDGWNPIYEPVSSATSWVHGYAKGLEMSEAAVAACTGNFESGKVVNVLLCCAALLLMGGALRDSFPNLSTKKVVIVTLLFGANPVLITQITTFYNDYALYCCLLITAAMMLRTYRIGWSWLWASMALLATMIGMVTKFTHGFYLGVEWGAFLLLLILSRKRGAVLWRSVGVAVVGAVLGLGVLGYHPYVTNVQRFGHPLYPLMGDTVEDIMTDNTPSVFKASGRIVNFAKSLCMVKRVTYDGRHGGFGPFMSGLLLLSLVLLALAWRKWQLVYVALMIFGSCFFFEQTWWARYIPFLWALIPISVLVTLVCYSDRYTRLTKIARCIIYTCALLTIPICLVDAVWLKIEATMYRKTLYDGAKQSGVVSVVLEKDDVHVRRRLDEAGVNYRIVSRCDIDTTRALFLTNDGFRGDIIELPQDVFNRITAHGLRYKLMRMNERTLDFYDDTRVSD